MKLPWAKSSNMAARIAKEDNGRTTKDCNLLNYWRFDGRIDYDDVHQQCCTEFEWNNVAEWIDMGSAK